MRRACVFATALFMLTACGGPRAPLTVGVKEINTDVLIGPQGPVPRATTPPFSGPTVGFPGFVQPPVIPPDGRPPQQPPACPKADPLSPVRHPTRSVASEPPVPRTYTYRDNGSFRVGARTGIFPGVSSRAIENVVDPAQDGGFTFDVTIPGPADDKTTTTYHVYPEQDSAFDPAAGIYIEQVVTTYADGSTAVFQPVPSLLLLPFPAAVSAQWDARGVDPVRQIVMQYHGTVTARGIVDACGTRLEGWVVDITQGTIRSPTSDITFSATLHIAPQYGGISLRDSVQRTGTENGEQVEIINTSRITREPAVPR